MKIFLTHTPKMRANYYGDNALNSLKSLAEVQLHEADTALLPAALITAAGDAEIVVSDRLTIGAAAVFSGLPKLRAFLRCAVDIRDVDVDAASAAGVLVTRAKPGFVESVAELTVGFLVDLARGISRSASANHANQLPKIQMGRQLSGSVIGIVGYGSIARHLAHLVETMGMKVLIADPHVEVDDPRFGQVDFETVLSEADHVVCLASATDASENLFNFAAFQRMKPEAVFVNVSRGNLVDEAALAAALDAGIIAGAAMDVGRALDQMPTRSLAERSNVIATPHIGGLTQPAIEAQAFDTVEQVRAIVNGKIPHGAINADRWSRRFDRVP
ncbi:MAG: NAD(P)-dependent oxidoreductase [Hyphomicrobiaceae bacterium]